MPIHNSFLPTLRFPEFREAGEWEEKILDPFLQGYSEKIPADTELPIYSSTRSGLKTQKEYYDNRELDNQGDYGLVPEGYFVYRHMSDDGYFKFNLNKTGGQIAVSKEYPVFTTIGLNSDFLFYILNYNKSFQEFAFAQKKGGTRARLYLKVLRTWNALLPTLPEQQKIAACLSSLDELITAHSQKLDALKKHKKGLMQQLFPAEGETVPTLRFPEFRGEWIETTLGFISNNISSGKEKNNSSGEYDLYGSTGIIGKTSSNAYKGKFILVARVGANAGLLTKVDGQFGVTDNTLIINLKEQKSIDFIFYNLDHLNLNKLIFGSGQPLITGGQLKSLNILVPTLPEQQKIAACLSSLDELITAHSQKLDALKKHKKGLMQQLFPAVDKGGA